MTGSLNNLSFNENAPIYGAFAFRGDSIKGYCNGEYKEGFVCRLSNAETHTLPPECTVFDLRTVEHIQILDFEVNPMPFVQTKAIAPNWWVFKMKGLLADTIEHAESVKQSYPSRTEHEKAHARLQIERLQERIKGIMNTHVGKAWRCIKDKVDAGMEIEYCEVTVRGIEFTLTDTLNVVKETVTWEQIL